MRIDQLLVARGLASTRSQAQRLIAGGVQWRKGNDWKAVVKNGDDVPDDASIELDFDIDGLSITCGANPEMSSRMQRMILAQAELEQFDRVVQSGGNPIPIIKNYFKRIGTENLDEIFPNESEMSPEEKAQMQQMQEMQHGRSAAAQPCRNPST